jgi:hypothetical protein
VLPLIETGEETTQMATDGTWMFLFRAEHEDAVTEFIASKLPKIYMESHK